nr:hypothetical protein CFP56_57050 [Quercus suber]
MPIFQVSRRPAIPSRSLDNRRPVANWPVPYGKHGECRCIPHGGSRNDIDRERVTGCDELRSYCAPQLSVWKRPSRRA